MSPDEVVGMAIFFGSIVSVIFILTVGSIIKAWVKKGSSENLSENREFLDALREFKENIDRRVTNLEKIVSADKNPSGSLKNSRSEQKNSQSAIELEMDVENTRKEKTEETEKLRNMLSE